MSNEPQEVKIKGTPDVDMGCTTILLVLMFCFALFTKLDVIQKELKEVNTHLREIRKIKK